MTLVEILVVVVILGSLTAVGVSSSIDTTDMAQSRAASDKLFFLLLRARQAGKTLGPDFTGAGTNNYGVCLYPGTILPAPASRVEPNAGFAALPFSDQDPLQPGIGRGSVPASLTALNAAGGLPLTRVLLSEPSVRLTRLWASGTAFPPTMLRGTADDRVIVQWRTDGQLDEDNSVLTALNKETNPISGSPEDADSWTFDVVATTGYQRFRLGRNGSITRSSWTDLSESPPKDATNAQDF